MSEHMLCIEVDGTRLEPELVFPDDEYLAAKLQLTPDEYRRHGERSDCDPLTHQDLSGDSLRYLKAIAYRGVVQPSAISRFAIIRSAAIENTPLLGVNSRASVYANEIAGDMSTALSQYIFDGDESSFVAARVKFLQDNHPDDDADTLARNDLHSLKRTRYITVIDNHPGKSAPKLSDIGLSE